MKQKIRILVDQSLEINEGEFQKAILPSLTHLKKLTSQKILEVDSEILKSNIESTFRNILEILENLRPLEGQFQIKNVSFTLGIDSTGKVSLLSAFSAEETTKVGFTFTLEKSMG